MRKYNKETRAVIRFSFFLFFGLFFITTGALQAAFLDDLHKFDLSLQYRVMYNRSNLPGAGGSTVSDLKDYDFFRQRFRISLDVQPTKRVGGFVQLEYRGGWGV